MKNSMFTKLFFLVIVLVTICEIYAFVPPEATVERIHPTGIRMSIPDQPGISLVAFHIKVNEDFDGLEAGHIAKDILKARNGRWTYEDRHTQLNNGDTVYYWVHVVHQGLGYNSVDNSYRV